MDDTKKLATKISEFKKPGVGQSFVARFDKLSPKAKQQMIIRYLVIILIVSVVGGLIWQHQKNNSRLAAMSYAVDGLSPSQKSQYYSSNGEYKLAEKVWQDQLAKTSDTPTQLSIYYMQSSVALKFKKYTDAQKYATQALKLAPTSSTAYVSLAQLAQAQGDKTSAKIFWQQAIKNIDPKNPASNLIKIDYQASLDALK